MTTIVAYHYVRDLAASRYPRIKGLSIERFEGQLDYIARHYSVCSLQSLWQARAGGRPLPVNSCILTFDDGLADHYQIVFPRLLERGMVGAFFPVALPARERVVLAVHKIHIILARVTDGARLLGETLDLVNRHRGSHVLPSDTELRERYGAASRFDPPEIAFVKKLLQHALPASVRSVIVAELFSRYADADEGVIAGEWYMDLPQLRVMLQNGMEIGGHGVGHEWLGRLSEDDQRGEIDGTAGFLKLVHQRETMDWLMCYPYGSYNELTLSLLRRAGCAAAVTTKVGLSNDEDVLQLSRLDTNDLPVTADAPVSQWTERTWC